MIQTMIGESGDSLGPPGSPEGSNPEGRSPAVSARATRPGRVLTWIALALGIGALSWSTLVVLLRQAAAFELTGLNRPDFLLTSCLPGLVLAPFFLAAYRHGRALRYRACGLWSAWGVLLFGLFVSIPRGVYSLGWFAQPVLVLLVTCVFGAVPGIAQASVIVVALVISAVLTPSIDAFGLPGPFAQAAVAGIVVVSMALVGSLLQRTLSQAIDAEHDQNLRMDEARRALRHRENLLRHAMRVDTVGEMSSMVIHQLRNQFQLIMGHAATGISAADEEVGKHFRSIVQSLGQSNELLEGLLGMSRRDSAEPQRVDLAELCRQMCESYQKVLPSIISFTWSCEDRPIPVLLDPRGLEHALLNLVINARQAIAGKGRITVRAGVREGKALIEVEDDGRGIPEPDLGQVFQPFFTTKSRGEGTGLGLAAVQRFVTSSRGEVFVESEHGVGTTFVLAFPLHSEDGSVAADAG